MVETFSKLELVLYLVKQRRAGGSYPGLTQSQNLKHMIKADNVNLKLMP
jgi:hypothetical protein